MKDNSGKIILAMLAGASAGVVAGLLMAPDTGEVTRSSVKKWANKLSSDLEKNLQTGLDEIKNMSSGVMDTLNKKASAMNGSSSDAGSSSTGSTSGSTGSTASTSGATGSTSGSTGSTSGSSGSTGSTGSTSGSTGGSTGYTGGAGSRPGGAI